MIIPWLPQKGDTEQVVEQKKLEISKLADDFAKSEGSRFEEFLAEFPQEDGHAPAAKTDALYTIVRGFLDWLTVNQK